MTNRKDGKPKKKGGWRLPKFALIIEPRKEKTEGEKYENEKIASMAATKLKRMLNKN